MSDISPKLLEAIKSDFQDGVSKSKIVSEFLKKAKDGTANQTSVLQYSSELGRILSESLQKNLNTSTLPDGNLYWNIAEKTVKPMLEGNHTLVNNAAYEVQRAIDQAEGINLLPLKTDVPKERIKGILDLVSVEGLAEEELQIRLGEPVRNATESFFDDFVKKNAKFRSSTGLSTGIIRVASSTACKWCLSLAGAYEEEDAPDDIYRRHRFCRCTVTFKSAKKYIDVWSKAEWGEGGSREEAIAAAEEKKQARKDMIEYLMKSKGMSKTAATRYYGKSLKVDIG